MAPRFGVYCVRYLAVLLVLISLLVPVAQPGILPGFPWTANAAADTGPRATGAQDVGTTPGQVNYYKNGYPLKASVLYTFNISVSYEWTLSHAEMLDYINRVKDFNSKLYDGTDGQMAIEKVDVWNSKTHWNQADIRYYNSNGRAFTYRGGIDYDGGHIFLYKYDSGKVIQHEWGHYGLYLPDEYTDWAGPFCTCTQGSTYNTDEWCCKNNHNAASQYAEASSCWEQIGAAYPSVNVKNPPVAGPYDKPTPSVMWHEQFDLATSDANMTIEPSAPTTGDLVFINATFTNYNYSIEGTQRFDLFDKDPALGGQIISSQQIDVTDEPTFVVPFSMNIGEGLNTFWLKGDPNNTIAELNENNNVAKGQVYVNHKPTVSPSMPKEFSGLEDVPLVVDLSQYERDFEDGNSSLVWNITNYDSSKIIDLKANYAEDEFTFTPLANWFGMTRVDLRLRDSAGATAVASIDLSFESVNDLPAVTDLHIDRVSTLRGGSAEIIMRGSDIETAEMNLKAYIEFQTPGGVWTSLQTAWSDKFVSTLETNGQSPLGNYSIRGSVLDANEGDSGWYYLNDTFLVMNNRPEVLGVIPSQSTIYRTESTTVQITGQDMEDTPDELAWEVLIQGPDMVWNRFNGSIDYVLGYSELTFAPDETAPVGMYHFRARATDSDGNTTDWLDDSEGILVMNNLPTAEYINTNVKEVYRTRTVEVRATGKDIEQGRGGLVPQFQYSFGQAWATEYLSEPHFDSAKGEWVANFTPQVGSPLGKVTFQARFSDADDELTSWVTSDQVDVRNNVPVCKLDGPVKGQAGDLLKFWGANSSDVEGQVTFEWYFGDGGTSSEPNPTHKYTAARSYTVVLTVKDPNGATDSKSITVNVNKKPDPPPPVNLPGSNKGFFQGFWGLLVFIIIIAILGFIGGVVYAVRKNSRRPPTPPTGTPKAGESNLLYEEFDQPGLAKPPEQPKGPPIEPPKDPPKVSNAQGPPPAAPGTTEPPLSGPGPPKP